jgi:D-threonate/D-erythronate kinase
MIGVVADDLTGAAELGAVGLRHGLQAEIIEAGQASGEANLVCIDTNSRSCGPKEAGRRAALAARVLRGCRAHWVYKKVDSVLRGQVVAELEAMMPQLGVKRALLVPANPALGRTISDGEYFIHGRPIHKTEFARDTEYPRLSPRVLDLMRASKHSAIHVGKAADSLPAEGIIVGEAGSSRDLKRWAAGWASNELPAGGAEFFGALLAREGYKEIAAHSREAPAPGAGPHLFVCGSLSESGREFIRAARKRGTPVYSLPQVVGRGGRMTEAAAEAIAREAIAALRLNPGVILHIGLPQVREQRVARLLATYLVRIAKSVLQRACLGQVYVEGGATAIELVRCMGWGRLTVLREVAPGVATLGVGGAPALCLTMKPGSYRWPDQIRELTGLTQE